MGFKNYKKAKRQGGKYDSVEKEELFLKKLFYFDATNHYHFIIWQCCIEYFINILKFPLMNPDENPLCVYPYLQRGEWKNVRSSHDNNDVVLAYKRFMDKNCFRDKCLFQSEFVKESHRCFKFTVRSKLFMKNKITESFSTECSYYVWSLKTNIILDAMGHMNHIDLVNYIGYNELMLKILLAMIND